MTIEHHPSVATLADFTTGRIQKLHELVVKAHLSVCPQCCDSIREIEHVGGDIMMSVQPDSTTKRLEIGQNKQARAITETFEWNSETHCSDSGDEQFSSKADLYGSSGMDVKSLYSTFLDCSFDALPWRPVGNNVKMCKLRDEGQSKMWLIQGQPGSKLPQHSHNGQELTLVLKGSYACSSELYSAGDIQECDEDKHHQPIIVGDTDCISLVVTDGKLLFKNWLPRVLQPFLGI